MFMRLRQGVRMLFGGRRANPDISKEVTFHLDKETEYRMAGGMTREDARRSALRDFGGVVRATEEVRDARGITFWDSLVQDVRFGLRTLAHAPGYTTAAIAILALGIGANTAMFSVIDGVLIKSLPFRDGDQLVLVQQSAPLSNVADAGVSIPELFEYRKRLQSVQDLVEVHGMSFVLLNQGEPDRVDTGVVSANFFEMLGVKPLYGRTFVPADDVLGAEAVLVLSYEYWQSKFGGDRNVIGRVLEMNNKPHTVVGILPSYPQYPRRNDVYMSTSACPFRSGAEQRIPRDGFRSFAALRVFGRLVPGATEERATAEIAGVAPGFSHDHPADYQRAKGFTGRARSLEDQLVTGARPMLLTLGGTTLLVLIIACANVANLALARTARRGRELALRTALGAGRARLLRQLITESLIVAIAGGVLGVGLAWLTLDMLVSFAGRFTPRTAQISIDATVLLFALGASVVTGIVFGAAPAFAIRRNLAKSMREGGAQAGEGGGRQRFRAGLVVAQVAVSFMLLVGAALLLRSFHRYASVELGYRTDHVMSAALFGNFSHQTTPEEAVRDGSAILERLRAAPGVQAASLTSAVPLINLRPSLIPITIEGRDNNDGQSRQVDRSYASDQYFKTLDIPVLEGREFLLTDDADALPVAIISASMAKFWNGASPVGTRFSIPPIPAPAGTKPPPNTFTVVGVVGDFRLYGGDQNVPELMYLPFAQTGGAGGGRLLVRTTGSPGDIVPTIKEAVHSVDAQMPVEELRTIDELKSGRQATPRLTATLLSVFAGVALLITLAGITGVIATSVSQRTREFGLRMALGASRASVLTVVLRQALALIGIGLVLGIGGAYFFSASIKDLLFATAPTDLLAYAGVAVLFIVAGVVACLAPARRATTIDPLSALRAE